MKKIPILPLTLPATGTWSQPVKHQFEEKDIHAIEAAYYSGRPLLLRGEPGSGKSQLGRALAHVWGRLFVSEVVNSRSESQDLHYKFDAMARLADAQAANIFLKDADEARAKAYLDPLKYLSPGVLWWVFNWENAEEIYSTPGHKGKPRKKPELEDERGKHRLWQPKDGAVILIDEIDKAETDLPNDLLETLGNGSFTVPWQDKAISMQKQNPPVVIVTTNDERELPTAFVRRCVVHDLNPPEDIETWLCKRGKVHFKNKCSENTRKKAARLLLENREKAETKGVSPPGQAEYLDLLRVLCKWTEKETDNNKRDKEHEELIHTISPYVYQKYPELKEG